MSNPHPSIERLRASATFWTHYAEDLRHVVSQNDALRKQIAMITRRVALAQLVKGPLAVSPAQHFPEGVWEKVGSLALAGRLCVDSSGEVMLDEVHPLTMENLKAA